MSHPINSIAVDIGVTFPCTRSKLEAPLQTTGQAAYPSDEPLTTQGLHAAVVYASQCACILTAIDASPALSMPGVSAFFMAKDIPGENTVGDDMYLFVPVGEVIDQF